MILGDHQLIGRGKKWREFFSVKTYDYGPQQVRGKVFTAMVISAINLYIKYIINLEKSQLIHQKFIVWSFLFVKNILVKNFVMKNFCFVRAKTKFFLSNLRFFPPQKRSKSNRDTPKLIKSDSFKEKIFKCLIILPNPLIS